MSFEESLFCRQVAEGASFSVIAEQLAGAELECRGQTPGLVIKANTQQQIYLRLPDLLQGFGRNITPESWKMPVTPLTLSHWIAGLSCFENCKWREALLQDTAVFIRQAPQTLSTVNIVSIFVTLKDMPDSDGVRKMFQAALLHLQKNTQAIARLLPKQVSTVLFCMKNLPDCAEARAILAVLTAHLRGNSMLMDTNEIGAALCGLQRMSYCTEVKQLLCAISSHIQANTERYRWMSTKALISALGGVQNMLDAMEVRAMLKLLHPHLVHLYQHVQLDANVASHILYGLKNVQDRKVLEDFCATLAQCFVDQPKPGQALSVALLKMVLAGLKTMPALPATASCYFRLLRHIFARADQVEQDTLTSAVYWLKNLPDSVVQQHPDVKTLLGIVSNRFRRTTAPLNSDILGTSVRHDIQERQSILPSVLSLKNIIDMIEGLQKLARFDKIAPVLEFIRDHLDTNAVMGNWLTPDEARIILRSLHDMHELPQARAILESLQMHTWAPGFAQLGVKKQNQWLAEAIFAMQSYRKHEDARKVADALITTIVQRYGLQLDVTRLRQPDLDIILELGQYVSMSGNMISLDVRDCSVVLANALCLYVITAGRMKGAAESLVILFHAITALSNTNEKAIYAMLQHLLANETVNWETGKVKVSLSSASVREGGK